MRLSGCTLYRSNENSRETRSNQVFSWVPDDFPCIAQRRLVGKKGRKDFRWMVWAVRLGKLRRGFRFPRRDLLVYSQRLAVALDPTLLYPLPLLATSTPRLTLYDPVTTQRQLSLLRKPEFRTLYRHCRRVERIAQSETRNARCTEPQTDLWIKCALEKHKWNQGRRLDTERKRGEEGLGELRYG